VQRARVALEKDPDIAEERLTLTTHRQNAAVSTEPEEIPQRPQRLPKEELVLIPLQVANRAHQCNAATRQLFLSVGPEKVRQFTEQFYQRSFADAHIDQFIKSHDDPHGERFALWIQEKFGDGTPWTESRKKRPATFLHTAEGTVRVAFDRSSAHFAAWHSPKREASKWGSHFKPDDARVWMRLHFVAARETGMFEHPEFMDYYVRFIAHFISVYSGKAPPFTRDSMRWSEDPQNVQRYVKAGCYMDDVIGKNVDNELLKLPQEEQNYTGSAHRQPSWPYERPTSR